MPRRAVCCPQKEDGQSISFDWPLACGDDYPCLASLRTRIPETTWKIPQARAKMPRNTVKPSAAEPGLKRKTMPAMTKSAPVIPINQREPLVTGPKEEISETIPRRTNQIARFQTKATVLAKGWKMTNSPARM